MQKCIKISKTVQECALHKPVQECELHKTVQECVLHKTMQKKTIIGGNNLINILDMTPRIKCIAK